MSYTRLITSPSWYRALTLSERATTFLQYEASTELIATEAGRKQFDSWQTQPPFNKDGYFRQRLALASLTEAQFLHILSEPGEAVRDRLDKAPEWLVNLLQIYDNDYFYTVGSLPSPVYQKITDSFLILIQPLLAHTADQLNNGIAELSQTYVNPPFDPATIMTILFANLPAELLSLLNPVLILELQATRLQGKLNGSTSKERYQSFITQLGQPKFALTLLQEYPVLARQLVSYLKNWVDVRLEFLRHLCQDLEKLQQAFSPNIPLGVLFELDDTAGDPHCEGRRVMIAKFSSGIRIVYKPKSLSIDVHFQELLAWLNTRCDQLSFRTIAIVDCETYGWVEFVSALPCNDEDEIERFYSRMGGYLALAYLLNGMDFHYENIIAVGEHPMLIDVELLFQPEHYHSDSSRYLDIVTNFWSKSVIATLMLPVQFSTQSEMLQVDTSGIGSSGEQVHRNILHLEGQGTDEMRFVRKTMPIVVKENRPTLQGHFVNPLDYVDVIIAGFEQIYHCLSKHQDELLADDGPITRCAEDEIRVIIRNTQNYSLLLRQSFQPAELRDSLHREKVFDRLWYDIIEFPRLMGAIDQEQQSLHQRDICLFKTRPNAHVCWSNHGVLPDVFRQSGLEVVRQRLQQADESDCARQVWLAQTALATLITDGNTQYMPHYLPASMNQHNVAPSDFITLATSIGEKIEKMAVRDNQQVVWLGLDSEDQERWLIDYSATDLYHGLPGISLFLAYLGMLTGKEKFTMLAQTALSTICNELEYRETDTIGGFKGLGGIIYTLSHLAVLWKKPCLHTYAEELIGDLLPHNEQNTSLGIVSGMAGYIVSLINLYNAFPSERTFSAILQCGDWFYQKAQPVFPSSASKGSFEYKELPLGFAHGASGIAWGLLKFHAFSGDEKFYIMARNALNYEYKLLYSSDNNCAASQPSSHCDRNKPDNRLASWYQGASGMGLARVRTLPYFDDPNMRMQIDTALQTTNTFGFGHNHSLGSGDLGHLEFLLQASQVSEHVGDVLEQKTSVMWQSIKQHGPLCGVPLGIETPGLINGLSGIGFGLLRLAAPDQVPSILLLDPPIQRERI